MRLVLPLLESMAAAHPDGAAPLPVDSSIKARILRKLNRTVSSVAEATIYNPRFALGEIPVLFALTPRHARMHDGRQVSMLLDFVIERMSSGHAVLEYRWFGKDYPKQPFGRRVFHLPDFNDLRCSCMERGTVAKAAGDIDREVDYVKRRIDAAFGIAMDSLALRSRIEDAVFQHETYLPWMMQFLTRLGMKLVVTGVHYAISNLILAKAAHNIGVPVAELQHGTIYHSHPAYNLPEKTDCSPDYLLSWGDYWSQQTRNYPNLGAISCGYPFLENVFEGLSSNRVPFEHALRILFISQGSLGSQLSNLAVAVRELLPQEVFRIAYKLHPNESRTWKERYPALAKSAIDVIENNARSIYDCFGDSDVTVGVCSTSIIEGFVWGLKAFIIDNLPGADTMSGFCKDGVAEYVHSADELACGLKAHLDKIGRGAAGTGMFCRERFFMTGAAEKIAAFIDNAAGK